MATEAKTQQEILAANKRVYFRVAILLAIITAIEFGLLYLEGLKGIMVPVLFILSAIKFGYIVSIFMHLKDDGKVLSGFFYSGFVIAFATLLGIVAIFAAWYA